MEEQLQKEAQVNRDHLSRSFAASDAELAWLLGLQQDVQAMLAGPRKFDYRPRPEAEAGVPALWELPETGVWEAARESGIVSLLPASLAQQYTADYRQADIAAQHPHTPYTFMTH